MRVVRLPSIREIPRAAWLALESPDYPFTDWDFLKALEASGSVGERSGWFPLYLALWDDTRLAAAMPLYAKTNSYGEYIFDWQWAHAYKLRGIAYYPKLTSAVPFTPATGPRILLRPDVDAEAARKQLVEALRELLDSSDASSAHALFITEEDSCAYAAAGFQVRHSYQYHWTNAGYADFTDYLSHFEGKRRRQVQRERRQAAELGLALDTLSGGALTPDLVDEFHRLYLTTIDKKQAFDYLTADFFREVFETMRDRIVLTVAREPGKDGLAAAALNFRKGRHLYGRYWGADEEWRNLHFELCYYRTIDYAITEKLARFEAGAQGEHKIQRGFLPSLTLSAHRLSDPAMSQLVSHAIEQEKLLVAVEMQELAVHSPFKQLASMT